MVKSVKSVYGYKIRRIIERSRETLETAEMDTIRRSMRISYRERITNEEIKQ